jgi:aryl-alcohol dehydrogenase-like predicted oxidoreductase
MNVFDRRFIKSGALERLNRKGVHVFVRSAFLQGLFFLEPEKITDPDLVRCAVPHIKTLKQLSEKAGMGIAQFAVSFLRNLPGIKSLVLGADNPEQVIENASLFGADRLNMDVLHQAGNSFDDVDYTGIMAVLSRPKQGIQ